MAETQILTPVDDGSANRLPAPVLGGRFAPFTQFVRQPAVQGLSQDRRNALGHAFMELHFLLVGCLYFEVLVGNAPVPRRPSHFARLGLLLVVMPFHSFFAIAVMNESTVIGGGYYRLLDRPYATDLLQDQYVGGSLTWALGEVPMVLLLMTLVIQWYRSDAREAVRHDRRADRDDDAELAAYNRMLGGLAAHDDELRTVDRGAVDRGAGGAGRR